MIENQVGIKKDKTIAWIPVEIDQNKGIKYEYSNWIMKLLRIPVVFILDLLPGRFFKYLLKTLSSPCGGSADISKWPTTFRAIEVMYTYPERRLMGETSIFEYFWFYSLKTPQALRNRLLLTTHQLLAKIKNVAEKKKRVYLLSLGCGSTRAIITALSELNGRVEIKAKLLDISRGAINFSQQLAKEKGVDGYQLEWYRDRLQRLEKYCNPDFQPDIVEMVGLLDYFDQERAIKLLRKIYKVLAPKGWLITCNIRSNVEHPLADKIGWSMIYRTPQELAEIVAKAGFPVSGIRIVYEPLKIHGLAIAQKLLNP